MQVHGDVTTGYIVTPRLPPDARPPVPPPPKSRFMTETSTSARLALRYEQDAARGTDSLPAVQLSAPRESDSRNASDLIGRSQLERRPIRKAMTVEIGFINPNQQTVVGATGLPGTDHGQSVYLLRCGHCGDEYGSNGSDNHRRRCPTCQGGRPGLPYR